MNPIFKKKRTANQENSLLTVTNMVTFIFILVFSLKMAGQEKPNKTIVPSIGVKTAFERDFPKEIPEWTKDFGGEDLDQIRYEAKFKSSNSRGLAVYDNEGNLNAYEVLIQKKDIPSNIVNYLKSNYANFTIDEASKVKNDKNEITYEIGIVLDGKFYDAVFDHEGDFLEITQKD